MKRKVKKIMYLSLLTTLYLLSAVWTNVFAAEFPDIERTHKNYVAVSELVEMGVISGYDDGYFRPEREITRTEFCALMARTLGYKKDEYVITELPFLDVKEGYWGEAYISFCYEKGIINGMGDGTFLPAEKVSLEQAVKMAVCAIEKDEEALSYEGESWYSGYVSVGEEYNLFYRIDQIFRTPSKRGDIAQLVYNMITTELLNDPKDEDDESFSGSVDDKGDEEEEEKSTIPPEILAAYKEKDFSKVETILIDAGHNYQGKDTGAENKELSLREEEITWEIADKLRKKLERQGYTVIMTREKMTDSLGNTSVLASLQKRVDLGHESLADLFISIHCNAGGGSGVEVYSFKKESAGGRLAEIIQKNISKETALYDRGTKTSNFFVINHTLMPAVLIETGFIDNESDAEIISSRDGQERIAEAISDAVFEYDTMNLGQMTKEEDNEDE